MANALARSADSVNVVVSSESAAGASMAAKTPCSARAVTSGSKLCAAPPAADAPANPSRPAMNVHLRPNRSAIRPPSSTQAAEGQRVGGDHPLAVVVGKAHVSLGGRQRDVH